MKHYVLTHFHSDHTVGLTRAFNGGTIYCTAFRLQHLQEQNLYCAGVRANFKLQVPIFFRFLCSKTCYSGCDCRPDHQHDWRGSFPCYCKTFGRNNRSNLPQILVSRFVHCCVLSSLLSRFVAAMLCILFLKRDGTLVMIFWRPKP